MKEWHARVRGTGRKAVVKAQSEAAAVKKAAEMWPGRAVNVTQAAKG